MFQDATINYSIKINAGEKKGQTIQLSVLVSDLENDDLATLLIQYKHLECWCNNDEFEVLSRRVGAAQSSFN